MAFPINDKLKLTRKQLSSFINDHDTLVQFERLIKYINRLIPEDDTDSSQALFAIESRANDLTSEVAELKKPLHNLITVAKSGGDFTTIEEALAFITDNSSTNRYTIAVAPGLYEVDNTAGALQLKSYCNISSTGLRSVTFTPKDPAQDMFLGNTFSHLVGIVFSGNTGTSYIVRHEGLGSTFIQDCVLRDCSNGFILNNASALFEIKVLAINNPAGTITINAINIVAGAATLDEITFRGTAKVTTGISISGTDSFVNIHNMIAATPGMHTAIKCFDGSKTLGTALFIGLCTDGLVVYGNDTIVEFDAVKIQNCFNDGFRIENVGTGINLSLFATTIINCVNLNFNILNPNVTVLGNGYTQLNKSFIIPGAEIFAYLLDTTEGDEGLNVFGELHVGTPTRPTESVFGGGDSYTNGMIVYTETTLGAFVDVSDEARSSSGSSFTFPGIAADNSIYLASILNDGTDYLEHFGIKVSVLTAAVKGAGSIIIEYWDGAAWTEVPSMEVESGGQYLPHANKYFENIGSQHIRYDSQLATNGWVKNDPMSLGTNYYWIRLRIDSAVTTAPIFEQFKLHTNRSELNSDGWIEYFGSARPIGQLPLSIGGDRAFAGTVQNQSIWINLNVAAGLIENRFITTTSYIGRYFFAPLDLDTSSPIEFIIAGRPTGTGTVEITIAYDWVTEGDIAYTSDPGLLPGKQSVSESRAVVVGEIEVYTFLLDVSGVLSRRDGGAPDFIAISINMSVLSGSNFDLMALEANYTKWCEGGHV